VPRLIDEIVPGGAAVGDDVVVALEVPVREPVVSHELLDVLDRVELGRAGRQRQDGDVLRHDEGAGEMPAGPVEDENGVGVGGDGGADLVEVRLHGGGVAERHDDAGTLALGRADRAEDIGPGGALVVRRAGPGAALRPPAGELVLLPDPGLVLEPELYALAGMRGPDRRHALWETLWNGPPLRRPLA